MFPLKDDVPSSRWPIVTVLLIIANVVIFSIRSIYADNAIRRGGSTGISILSL